MIDIVSLAVETLLGGDVVALPTETVYGLAAVISSDDALRKIFQIKGRPLIDPLIVHILDNSWISRCAFVEHIEARVKTLTDTFWPGPLTIVLKRKPSISSLVTSGLDSVALRCPAHELFREILRLINIPLAAPSANPFGYLSPTTAQHVKDTLGDRIKVIVDGGKCSVGVESTILDMTSNVPQILRPGAISASDIANILDTVVLDYSPEFRSKSVPGQLPQHYAPHTKLVLFSSTDDVSTIMRASTTEKTAFVCIRRPDCFLEKDVFWLSENGDYQIVASSLFDMLQTLDELEYDVIYCQRAENVGIGIAINDRLTRAAAKFITLEEN